MDPFFTVMLTVMGIYSLLLPVLLLRAWVLTILWKWFVVTQFQLPAITLCESLGLILILNMLVGDQVYKKEGITWQEAMIEAVKPVLALLVGVMVRMLSMAT